VQKFTQRYPTLHDTDHPLSHKYWVRPVLVLWATEGVVQYTTLKPFKATAAATFLAGLVQAAKGVHVTESGTLEPLGPDRPHSTLQQLWKAFRAFRTAALKAGKSESQVEKEWNQQFSAAFRPHFQSYHEPGTYHFYSPAIPGGAIGGRQLTAKMFL
jgi:hypothetical protein